ncbi:MAG: hypothetical protein AABW99_03490 [archaeon]
MDKEQIIRDSVRKLVELNIPDKEIIYNLKNVGIEEDKARRVLQETKDEVAGKRPAQQASSSKQPSPPPAKPVPEQKERSFEGDDLYSEAYEELEEERQPRVTVKEKPINNPSYSSPQASDKTMSELWEKGIMATVDAKLGEMQKLKDELDAILDAKIQERLRIEVKKIETVFDSQKVLLSNKIDMHLQSKADEIHKVVESKAREMEDLYAKAREEMLKVQREKQETQKMLSEITGKLEGLEMVKNRMISETNASIIQAESGFSDFMEESKAKRQELEERINRALQLESKITEGLIQNANQKIDSLALEKEGELTKQLQAKMREIDEMVAQVDPKSINDRILALKELEKELVKRQKEIDKSIDNRFEGVKNEFNQFKKDVAKLEDSNLGELKKEYAASIDDLFAENIVEWNKKLKEKRREIEDMKKQMDLEKFNATMEALDIFKKQFVKTIKVSIDDYNKTKAELADAIIERDRNINDYLKKIDAKMAELSDFEKKFAKDVSEILEKMPSEKQITDAKKVMEHNKAAQKKGQKAKQAQDKAVQ